MILDQFRLDGQTALVTGCRRGIGMALAEALAEAGADIIGVSASLRKSGEEVAARVTRLGRRFHGFHCDFADRKALHQFIREVTTFWRADRYFGEQRRHYPSRAGRPSIPMRTGTA